MADLRVVVVNPFQGKPTHAQRCAPCNVQFACRQHVLSEAQASIIFGAPQQPPIRLRLPGRIKRKGVLNLRALMGLVNRAKFSSSQLIQLDNVLEIEEDRLSLDQWLIRRTAQMLASK